MSDPADPRPIPRPTRRTIPRPTRRTIRPGTPTLEDALRELSDHPMTSMTKLRSEIKARDAELAKLRADQMTEAERLQAEAYERGKRRVERRCDPTTGREPSSRRRRRTDRRPRRCSRLDRPRTVR